MPYFVGQRSRHHGTDPRYAFVPFKFFCKIPLENAFRNSNSKSKSEKGGPWGWDDKYRIFDIEG